ncbi:MAG: APC family permease [Vulcanimicrobiaceae bacterium]
MSTLARSLGAFDVVLITMGAIIGSGIFAVPSLVALRAHSDGKIIIAVWLAGGAIACLGGAVFAQLAARSPGNGGMYAYLRESFHPIVAFSFGWSILILTAGTAAAALIFAEYFARLTGLHLNANLVASGAIVLLMLINFLGVRHGGTVQNIIMVLKIVAIVGVITCGILVQSAPASSGHEPPMAGSMLGAFCSALIAALFAYLGLQNATYVSGEARDPTRTMPIGLFWGVVGVSVIYLAVNIAALRALGAVALAHSQAPLADVVRRAMGAPAERAVAVAVTLSTLGLISNNMLDKPRLYHAMARDGLFPAFLGWVHPRTHAPIPAIAIQGIATLVLALSGTFQTMVTYATTSTFVFYAVAAAAAIASRKRAGEKTGAGAVWAAGAFCAISTAVVVVAYAADRIHTTITLAIILSAVPAYAFFARRSARYGAAA